MLPALDLRQGDLEPTGRGTDIALRGEGFFVVQDAGGNEFYTRSGSFGLDDQHRLVTAQGYLVQGSGGEIVLAGNEFSVGEDGTVTADGTSPGRLRVVTFADPQQLEHRGDGLLRAPADMPATDAPAEHVDRRAGLPGAQQRRPRADAGGHDRRRSGPSRSPPRCCRPTTNCWDARPTRWVAIRDRKG